MKTLRNTLRNKQQRYMQNRCSILKNRYVCSKRVSLMLLCAALRVSFGLSEDITSIDEATMNGIALPVECSEKIIGAQQSSEQDPVLADQQRKGSARAENDLDDFFDPQSNPVTKPKLSKPSRIEVWGRTIGIYVLHKVMGFTDWFKKLLSPKEKKHGKAKAKGKAKKRSA